MQKLFFSKYVSEQGYSSTEEYICASATNGWINFKGYESFRDLVTHDLIVPGRTQVRVSNGLIDQCYFVVDVETLEGNTEIPAHQGLPGRHSAREILENPQLCSDGWCVSSSALSGRLKIKQRESI